MKRSTIQRNSADALTLYSAENLRNTLRQATDEEWQEGLAWYSAAHTFAQGLASRYSLSPTQAAGIIAALSPQTSWEYNLIFADRFCQAPSPTSPVSLGDPVRKAFAIYQGQAPLDVLGGPKVRAFYRNIAFPTLSGHVTIDRHALAALAGLPTPTYLRTYTKHVERKCYYGIAAGVYRQVARELSLAPHDLQAVAWVTHRNREWNPGDF